MFALINLKHSGRLYRNVQVVSCKFSETPYGDISDNAERSPYKQTCRDYNQQPKF